MFSAFLYTMNFNHQPIITEFRYLYCEIILNVEIVNLFYRKLKVSINKASNSCMETKLIIEHNLQAKGQAILESRCKLLRIDMDYAYFLLRSYCTGISIFQRKISASCCVLEGKQACLMP